MRRVIEAGWVEGLVGALWVMLSLYGFVQGRMGLFVLLWDLVALGALIVSLVAPRVGTTVMVAVCMMGLIVDPDGIGLSLYLAGLIVVGAVRRGRFGWAVTGTIGFGAPLALTVFRRSASDRDWGGALFAWVFVYAIAWVLGMGFRQLRRAEAARLARALRERQIVMATDIHNSVGRNLTNLVLQAEAARLTNTVSDELVASLAERARLANHSLRGITAMLVGEDPEPGAPDKRLRPALAEGVAELEHAGFTVLVDDPGAAEPVSLPEEVDLVGGRILAEALHNVRKHGAAGEPVAVVVGGDPNWLRIRIRNGHHADAIPDGTGLGLHMMQRHAGALGGTVDSGPSDGQWLCSVKLPRQVGKV